MKFIKIFLSVLVFTFALTSCKPENSSEVTVGIIEPLQHKAMDEIVAGFTETLHALYKKPVKIKIENAQADPNMERAIVQKMHDANYTVIAPIGVDASQMTLAVIHDKPVVSLASDISDNDRKKLQPCNVAVVHDEISSQQILKFIHTIYPNMKEITLIYSSGNKVLPEVQDTIKAAKSYGINIKAIMVSSLPELYTASQSLPDNTQGIFVLKDSLIVSGVTTLAKAAAEKHIPLITSDQGSVEDGAGFALGVHEREIGVQGAKLVAAILNGNSACNLPIATMNNLTVFINSNALKNESQSVSVISAAAKKSGYKTEIINQAE